MVIIIGYVFDFMICSEGVNGVTGTDSDALFCCSVECLVVGIIGDLFCCTFDSVIASKGVSSIPVDGFVLLSVLPIFL